MPKTILITGANRGIGLELARQYAAGGWRVHACCRQPERASELRALAGSAAGRVTVHSLDVTDSNAIAALADALRGSPIDILLNNAGVSGVSGEHLGNLSESEWTEVLRVNTIAPFMMAGAFLDHVKLSSSRIIATISSKMGSIADNGSGGRYAYRSSKTAVNMVMKSLAVDLREAGVIAVTLNPGWVRTRMGGTGAPLAVEESAAGLRNVLDRIKLEDSGSFLNHDGSVIPW